MANFVIIKERRIRKTGIKEYEPIGDKSLKVVFNHSRNKTEKEVFSLGTKEERDLIVSNLDNLL